MSIKLPVELLATWIGPRSDYSEGPSPLPGTRYRIRVEEHKIDANAVKVQIMARADGSGGSGNWNWTSNLMHSNVSYPLSINWADIRLLDNSLPTEASWL